MLWMEGTPNRVKNSTRSYPEEKDLTSKIRTQKSILYKDTRDYEKFKQFDIIRWKQIAKRLAGKIVR